MNIAINPGCEKASAGFGLSRKPAAITATAAMNIAVSEMIFCFMINSCDLMILFIPATCLFKIIVL